MVNSVSVVSSPLFNRSKLSDFFVCLLGVAFTFYFVIPGWYKLMPLFMLLLAVYLSLSQSIKTDRRLVLFCVLLLLIPIAGDLINIMLREVSSWSNVEKVLRNLLLIYPLMIAVAMRRDLSLFFYYALVGMLCVTAVFCVAQLLGFYAVESSHFRGVRTGLWWNPIPFSNAVVFILAACCAAYVVLVRSGKIQGWFAHTAIAVAVLAGVLIVILSGTRGSLLGLAMLILVFITVLLLSPAVTKGYRLLFALTALVFIFVASYVMQDRFMLAYVEALDHFSSGAAYTSVSIRLSAWSFSVQAFLDNPLLGLGVDATQDYKAGLIAQGMYPPYLMDFHAHSDIFDTLERSGLLGITGLFFLYVSPLIMAVFFRYRAANLYPLLFVTLSAFLVGLTDTPLRNNISTNAFFLAFFVVLFICLRNADVRENTQ